jgi:hypothetical protein
MTQPRAELQHDDGRRVEVEHPPAHVDTGPVEAAAQPIAGRLFTSRPDPVATKARPWTAGVPATSGTIVRRRVSVRGAHGLVDPFGQTLMNPAPTAFDQDAENLLTIVDNMTVTAMHQIINRPLFTGLAELVDRSGYLTLWVQKMKDAVNRGYTAGLSSAQFGYAIETLTCHLLGGSQGGWTLDYQIASGSTRPDIVATKGNRQVWLDLTADSALSVAHIYTIKRWDRSNVCPHPHAEIVYPPMSGGVMATMIANAKLELAGNPPAAQVDANALQASIRAAEAKLQQDINRWRTTYGAPFRLEVSPSKVTQRGDTGTDPDGDARAEVFDWFNRNLGTMYTSHKRPTAGFGGRGQRQRWAKGEKPRAAPAKAVDPKLTAESAEAGSVLIVLGIQPASYGIVNGTPSRARGIAFLTKLDQKQDESDVAAATTPVMANTAPVFVFGANSAQGANSAMIH